MAEFLTTTGISERLERIVKEADEYLVLISPYIKVNPRIRDFIKQKAGSKTKITIIYGKKALNPEEREWLDSLPSIGVYFRENLHAKCYINDKEALLTSMNLYQFSEQYNDEWGILVSKGDSWRGPECDRELYRSIAIEANQIVKMSEVEREVLMEERTGGLFGRLRGVVKDRLSGSANTIPSPELVEPTQPVPAASIKPTIGFCIRCKADLVADPKKPYCEPHLRTWNRYKNLEYKEKYCHTCGDEFQATMLNPLCSLCDQKYKDAFEFAS